MRFQHEAGPPHRPSQLLLFEAQLIDHIEPADPADIAAKIEALLCHQSQWRSTMQIDERPDDQRAVFAAKLRAEARTAGLRAGLRAAESFARIDSL